MPYSSEFITRIKAQPTTLIGTRLALWAIYHDISVTRIAKAIGATRQSVYNWMSGGNMMKIYEDRIQRVTNCMQDAKTADEAWRRICKEFNLRT
ncbi:hypothetical protein EBT31_13255 [bacterium]|jgi:predicted DNA-binding protein YlxM (UPF0122 family)|nr:hypothetical protein [bacterium]